MMNVNELYYFGVLTENYNFPEDKTVAILEDRIEKYTTKYGNLINQVQVPSVINKLLVEKELTSYKTEFTSLFFDLIQPNLSYDNLRYFGDESIIKILGQLIVDFNNLSGNIPVPQE